MNEMNDRINTEDLIRAMEYCIDENKQVGGEGECLKDICPYTEGDADPGICGGCEDLLMRDALVVIKRQRKKIEKLKKKHRTKKELEDRIKQLEQEIHCFGMIQYNVDEQATEFYKEYLDKLKDYAK